MPRGLMPLRPGIVSQNPPYQMLYTAGAKQNASVTIGYKPLEGVTSLSSIAAAWRKLPWWVEPVTIVVALSAFGLYSLTIVLLYKGHYEEYLSPFYSPPVPRPGWLPAFIPARMFFLWIPLGLGARSSYSRKASSRFFFGPPPACSGKAQQH